jgi:hypothetical protein
MADARTLEQHLRVRLPARCRMVGIRPVQKPMGDTLTRLSSEIARLRVTRRESDNG